MSGLDEVARRAGVAPATASRALTGRGYVAEATRQRVIDAAREIGYAASSSAASLKTGRTRTIGVIVPALGRWYFSQVVEGVQASLLAHDHDLVLYDAPPGSDARERMFDYFLARKRFDGIIAVGIDPADHERERLLAFDRPIVTIGGYDIGTSMVGIDDENAARVATEHLIDLGHCDIAFLGGDPDGGRSSYGDARRMAGYAAAMSDAGADVSDRRIPCPASMPGGYHAAIALLADRRRRPTAIVGVCDDVAIGAIIAARRLGIRVPAELSVIGIDDHDHAEMFGLTTLAQSPRTQGAIAVEHLMFGLEGTRHAAQRTVTPVQLIVRASTGVPAGVLSASEADHR